MTIGVFMPIVDDKNDLVGALPRMFIHHLPIHQAVSVLLVGGRGEIYFQKRSLACRSFPGCYDIVGGHVKTYNEYLETAYEEVASETPLRVSKERFERVLPGDGHDFFRVRTTDNWENKALFVVRLSPGEEQELSKIGSVLREVWDVVARSVAPIFDGGDLQALRGFAHRGTARQTTRLGAALQTEFTRLIESAIDADERSLRKRAREVEDYVSMSWSDALDKYQGDTSLFADGFYSLIDRERNTAPQVPEYHQAIAAKLNEITGT